MIKQQVQGMMNKSHMPPNCECIKYKWMFKIKCNSVYWACLVACGYSKVPSADFSENYLPVVNDIFFHIFSLMVIQFGYPAKIINIETTFLCRDFEEEIYMECPWGMSDKEQMIASF